MIRSQDAPVNDRVVVHAENVNAGGNVIPVGYVPRPKEFKFESFKRCGAKDFYGNLDAVGCMEWLEDIEVVFASCNCPEDKKVLSASRMLKEGTRDWWRGTTVSMTPAVRSALTWDHFKEKFMEEYIGTREKRLLEKEFRALKADVGGMAEYARSFMSKIKFVEHLVPNEEDKVAAYVDGIPASYRGICRQHATLAGAIKESKKLVDDFKTEKATVKANDDKKSGSKRKYDGSSGSSGKFKKRSSSTGVSNNYAKPKN
uniref:uncharacterized protein LOC122587913 n=1 Tax=Erigeron canadensis TaxID=72917 RepID=UPI001CB9D75B|nr:uncharacterized protein LOC122587913 [Erigeron canadensis]